MGEIGGFKLYKRINEKQQPVSKRLKNYNEFTISLNQDTLKSQASRCMNCGVPFCHSGCPLGNLIPDFNDYIHRGEWKKALNILHSTNNFPEFTGRLCPAPCEKACVLGIIDAPVSIENIEKYLVERGFKEGWIKPKPPTKRTGKTIAIVGSGPAGLAVAQQLNRSGHLVTVFERDDKLGGLLRYGIPNFKLEKNIIDRRINILEEEGIIFKTNVNVGINYNIEKLQKFDAIVLCGGATIPRNLPINKFTINGVHQAMDYLKEQTKALYNQKQEIAINAKNKNVIVIGGGDTGSDCVGTANRQGASSVVNFEILPKPSKNRDTSTPWPFWPLQLKTTTSHDEGCDRNWLINTKEFLTDDSGNLTGIKTVKVKWEVDSNKKPVLIEQSGSEKIWPCDLVLLSLGFTGPEKTLAEQLELKTNQKGNYSAKEYQTNIPKIFTAGDMRRGQSLIVWAISEGREAAKSVNKFLLKKNLLPYKGQGDLLNSNN